MAVGTGIIGALALSRRRARRPAHEAPRNPRLRRSDGQFIGARYGDPVVRIELPDDPFGEVILSVPDPDGTAQAIPGRRGTPRQIRLGRGVTTG